MYCSAKTRLRLYVRFFRKPRSLCVLSVRQCVWVLAYAVIYSSLIGWSAILSYVFLGKTINKARRFACLHAVMCVSEFVHVCVCVHALLRCSYVRLDWKDDLSICGAGWECEFVVVVIVLNVCTPGATGRHLSRWHRPHHQHRRRATPLGCVCWLDVC